MDFNYLFTSFEGRINRKLYWIGAIILIAAWLAIVFLLALLVGIQDRSFLILSFVIQLVLLYPSAALMVKRLQDRSRPGWFAALLLGPVLLQGLTNVIGPTGVLNQGMLDTLLAAWIFLVALWFFIELGCLRGTVGPNRYGPDPLGEKA